MGGGWFFISLVVWFWLVCMRVCVDFRMDLQVPESAWNLQLTVVLSKLNYFQLTWFVLFSSFKM